MDTAPRISVIIPHLNQPEALARCLASLAAQEGGVPFEVIVVDNGSAVLPEAVCARVPGVRLLREATPGPGPARSLGAGAARGAVLAFTDADCIAAPGWLVAIDGHFADPANAPVVGGDVRIAPVDPRRLTMIEAYESVFGYRNYLYIARDNYAASCNMAVRREVFEAVGPFPGIGVAEDRAWGVQATALGYRHHYLPEMLVLTPARASFSELVRKWDRHIAHDLAALPPGVGPRIKWGLRATALAASPVADLGKIVTSDRLQGLRARAACFAGLVRIRLYRAVRMLAMVAARDRPDREIRWNR